MDHRRAVQGISARAGVGRMVLDLAVLVVWGQTASVRAARAPVGLVLGEAVLVGLVGVDAVQVALAP